MKKIALLLVFVIVLTMTSCSAEKSAATDDESKTSRTNHAYDESFFAGQWVSDHVDEDGVTWYTLFLPDGRSVSFVDDRSGRGYESGYWSSSIEWRDGRFVTTEKLDIRDDGVYLVYDIRKDAYSTESIVRAFEINVVSDDLFTIGETKYSRLSEENRIPLREIAFYDVDGFTDEFQHYLTEIV